MNNICLTSDSYKQVHYRQYPPGTRTVYSYFESRSDNKETVFFGLQYLLKKYLRGKVVTHDKIEYAQKRVDAHMGPGTFNRKGWDYILKKYDGHLPIRIMAVPEGTIVDTSNVLMTVENTDDKCYWLTNFLETLLSQVWYPTTVATNSMNTKRDIKKWLINTGCNLDGLSFKLHDFGFRGVSSTESAGIGGCAHLSSFLGTDTMEALEVALEYYDEDMAGFSIPASEHSTITSWGKDNEDIAMQNMLQQYPTGLVACVSDSFNIYRACAEYWGTKLRSDVLARNGVLVIRPDSGNMYEVLPMVCNILWDKFGGTVTSTGHKLLDNHVRLIQGDGIEPETPGKVLAALAANGFAADVIAFGSGGGLLQKINRDTFKFAFKCSAINRNGEWQDVYKEPVTDKGKNSKRGRLCLYMDMDGSYYTASPDFHGGLNQLETVFENGKLVVDQKLSEIRERINLCV